VSNDLDALLADRPDVGVVLVKVDQTGQPRTPSRKFKSTVYGKCLLLKENPASPIASIPKSTAGQESTLQRKLTPGLNLRKVLSAVAPTIWRLRAVMSTIPVPFWDEAQPCCIDQLWACWAA